MKSYVMFRYDSTADGGLPIGVYLDKDKCESDLHKLNHDYDEAMKKYNVCFKCRQNNNFELSDTCNNSKILTDRNGQYCENDCSDYYSVTPNYYNYTEVDIKE